MRTAVSLLLTVGLVASLAACTAGTASADCTPTPSGAVSAAVKASGKFGADPAAKFSIPVDVKATQRSVLIQGDGTTVVEGDTVSVQFTIYSGASSAAIVSSDYTSKGIASIPVDPAQFLKGVVKTIECSQVGSRVVGVIPPSDAFGATGSTNLGVGPKDNILFVVDIISIKKAAAAPLPKADGTDVPAEKGFPTVVLDADGTPTVTIPDATPPTDLKIENLKKGSGAKVKAGDDVVVNYIGINWNTKATFDSSWARGATAKLNTESVIAGFKKALVGQAVGSQVVVIIPPADGYGAQGQAPDIGGTDTLVFVIDILGIG